MIIRRLAGAATLAALAHPASAWQLETLATQPAPGVYAIRAGDPPRLELLDQDPAAPGPQGVVFPTVPTSLAVHPRLGVVFITLLSTDPARWWAAAYHPTAAGC